MTPFSHTGDETHGAIAGVKSARFALSSTRSLIASIEQAINLCFEVDFTEKNVAVIEFFLEIYAVLSILKYLTRQYLSQILILINF
jgi:hypothetical protein